VFGQFERANLNHCTVMGMKTDPVCVRVFFIEYQTMEDKVQELSNPEKVNKNGMKNFLDRIVSYSPCNCFLFVRDHS
jgi:hypothetical protein